MLFFKKNTDEPEPEVVGVNALYYRRLFLIAIISTVTLVGLGSLAYYIYAGFRAQHLALQAKQNFEKANYNLAWREISRAYALRAGDPEVLRVLATIESAFGLSSSLGHFDALAAQEKLTPDELEARASSSALYADDQQFDRSVEELSTAGRAASATQIRIWRKVQRGDLDGAIQMARGAVSAMSDAGLRLSLIRLLQQRFGGDATSLPASKIAVVAGQEIVELVDSLQSTGQAQQALAMGLGMDGVSPDALDRWSVAVMDHPQVDHPALLLAAGRMLKTGVKTPVQMYDILGPVFASASATQKATFARWLSAVGLPAQALALTNPEESVSSTLAFQARADALLGLKDYRGLMNLAGADSPGGVDSDVRFSALARAKYGLGQNGEKALSSAMASAAQAGRLKAAVQLGDSLGASHVVDESLVHLCGDLQAASNAFALARDRFGRQGKFSALEQAYARAREAAPLSLVVCDYARYLRLLAGEKISPEETADAVSKDPANITLRTTHALALVSAQKPTEALQVFNDCVAKVAQMTPSEQVAMAVVFSANDDFTTAISISRNIQPTLLKPDEKALLEKSNLPVTSL